MASMEGYLKKRSPKVGHELQKRFFRLNGATLSYFKDEKSLSDPKGTIPLGCAASWEPKGCSPHAGPRGSQPHCDNALSRAHRSSLKDLTINGLMMALDVGYRNYVLVASAETTAMAW